MPSLRFTPPPKPDAPPAEAADAAVIHTPKSEPKPAALPQKRLLDGEYVRRDYRASVESGTPWSRVCQGDYWFVVSPRLRAGDTIECVLDNLAWHGRLIVMQAVGTTINVAPLSFVELDSVAPVDLTERSGFRVVDEGLTDKFCIYRMADNMRMASGIDSAELAHQMIHQDFVPRARKRGFG